MTLEKWHKIEITRTGGALEITVDGKPLKLANGTTSTTSSNATFQWVISEMNISRLEAVKAMLEGRIETVKQLTNESTSTTSNSQRSGTGCEYLHEDWCTLKGYNLRGECKFQKGKYPKTTCTATDKDLLTEEEYLKSLKEEGASNNQRCPNCDDVLEQQQLRWDCPSCDFFQEDDPPKPKEGAEK